MACAEDVIVVIPVGIEHQAVAGRAQTSAWESGVGSVQVLIDTFKYGVCYSRNALIRYAKTDLILPLDADDYLLPGAVERMAAAWSPGKVVYGNWAEYTDHLEVFCGGLAKATLTRDTPELVTFEAPPVGMLPRKHVCHATYLFAKEDWLRVGGYDPDFNIGAEDWEFMIALVESGCELVRLDGDPLYVKTIGENERTHKAIRRKDIIKQLLLEKHPKFFSPQ